MHQFGNDTTCHLSKFKENSEFTVIEKRKVNVITKLTRGNPHNKALFFHQNAN